MDKRLLCMTAFREDPTETPIGYVEAHIGCPEKRRLEASSILELHRRGEIEQRILWGGWNFGMGFVLVDSDHLW